MTSRRHIPAWTAAITAAYFLLAIGAVRTFGLDLPGWLETALSALAAPAVILLLAWNPVFAPLGMTSGEAVVVPTLLPCLAIIALYAGVAWAVARVLARRG